ncbi:MAG: 16S rRNA (uracil(1498)-N(3))-methyltransferase [Propionibacteriaceae bacterium]|nr:16S rRNA (uracil(1498)-N(3))-methyltransferase [Propionibacteriaceae bacterium]
MTEPLFLGRLSDPRPGQEVVLDQAEGHHAADVRRVRVGEVVIVSDGAGRAVKGPVVGVEKGAVKLRVEEVVETPEPPVRYVAVQALPKGDRAELAVAAMTEAGAAEIVPWQAERSVVRWAPDRVQRGLARWRAWAREAAKQSRRLRVPLVGEPLATAEVARRLAAADCAIVFHESAATPLAAIPLPASGELVFVIGPEGGLTDAELEAFTAAGGQVALLTDGVLRTSTAGVFALGQLQALGTAAHG